MLTISRLARVVVTATALLLSGACSDETGPTHEDFDPAKTSADLDALDQVVENLSMRSFFVMSGYFSLSKPTTAPRKSGRLPSGILVPVNSATSRNFTAQAASHLATELFSYVSSVPLLNVIPPDKLGTTYTFDQASQNYVASTRKGAPSHGVRFVLYAIDAASFVPIIETETGYVDILDLGSGNFGQDALHVTVVSEGAAQLDYSYTSGISRNSTSTNAAGFINDGSIRLNFELNATQEFSGFEFLNARFDFTLAIPSRGFSINGLGNAPSFTSRDETVSVESGGASVRYDLHVDESAIDGAILVNDEVFAMASGEPGAPSVAGANGHELTNEERLALTRLLNLSNASNAIYSRLIGAMLWIVLGVP